MTLTKQRKIFAAILGLAALAFLVDRLFLLPAGADAASVAAPETENSAGPAEVVAPSRSGPTLASKLHAVGATVNESPDRDPFDRTRTARGDRRGPAAERVPSEVAAFEAGHELTAVLSPRSGKGMAVIARKGAAATQGTEGQSTLRIGEEVDGWTLVELDVTSATFRSGTSRLTLELKGKVDNHIQPRR